MASLSAKCALSSCNRPVRYDNPTAPYCTYHATLKRGVPSATEFLHAPMKSAREILYNPKRSMIPARSAAMLMVSDSLRIDFKIVKNVVVVWEKSTKGKDMWKTSVALSVRNELLNVMMKVLEKYGSPKRATCQKGGVWIPGKGRSTTDDHEIIIITFRGDRNEMTYVVDVATAAPLHKISEDVHDIFPDGDATCSDGIGIYSLTEYAMYSSVSYSTIITESGESVWENPDKSEDSSVEFQRELIQKHGTPKFPPVVYRDSPQLSPPPEEEKNDEPEPQSLEDLLD